MRGEQEVMRISSVWNISKLSKWLNSARKNRLYIDFESGYMLDGFSIFKINDELKKILNTHYMITGSISICNGEIIDNNLNLKKIFDDFTNDFMHKKYPMEFTQYSKTHRNVVLNIFYSDELVLGINKNFIELIDPSFRVKYYGTGDAKPLAVQVDDEIIGFILPSRNTSPYEIKKATHK